MLNNFTKVACAHCGSLRLHVKKDKEVNFSTVICLACGAEGPPRRYGKWAIKAWEKRV